MGVDGVNINIKNIWIKEGEDFSVITPDGITIFVCLEDGSLTFCNETDSHYCGKDAECIAEPQREGGWVITKDDGP